MDQCISVFYYADHELTVGSEVLLPSHGYPNNYPSDAYVLWTFQYASGIDSNDIMYQISFGYLQISSNDYLTVGYGWNPNNATTYIISYGYSYNGLPPDIFTAATKLFVEFDASSSNEAEGFQLTLSVRNISGMFGFQDTYRTDMYAILY